MGRLLTNPGLQPPPGASRIRFVAGANGYGWKVGVGFRAEILISTNLAHSLDRTGEAKFGLWGGECRFGECLDLATMLGLPLAKPNIANLES